jgi:hypothetical protein
MRFRNVGVLRGVIVAGVLAAIGGDGAPVNAQPAPATSNSVSDASVTVSAADRARARALLKARLGQSFALADLNRDGILDVAAADFLTNSVQLLFGEAAGGFRTPESLQTGSGPRAVVAGDFTGDGVVDLAVAEFFSGSVRIFGGRGDGQFRVADTVPVGPGLTSLVAHDADGDTHPELAAANALSGEITLLKSAGSRSMQGVRVGSAPGSTLLLTGDATGDGLVDLVAIDADGMAAWLFEGSAAGLFQNVAMLDPSTADAVVERSLAGANGTRLRALTGDGQTHLAGSAAREPLMVEAQNITGSVSVAELVWFARVGSASIADASGQLISGAEIRETDSSGRAWVSVALPRSAEASVIFGSLPPDQVVAFRVAGLMDTRSMARALESTLAADAPDPRVRSAYLAALRLVVEQLDRKEATSAVATLAAMHDQLAIDQANHQIATGSSAGVVRRMINQILLVGSAPESADDETIVCDVPLTRTIAATTEVDRFSFASAIERVHITLGNEGGMAFFTPVWRLMGPDGNPAVGSGCDIFSAVSRDCVLSAAGTYAIEVEDSGHDSTGAYNLNLQRLMAGQRCGTTITCDVPVTGALNSRADTNLHELAFTPVAGERVHITFGNDGGTAFFTPAWRLLAPDGSPAAGSGCDVFSAASRDCVLAATAGYAVEVEDSSHDAASGSYNLNIQRLTVGQRCGTTINCDVPVSSALNGRADTNLHELAFTPVGGERVHITFGNDGGTAFFTPDWRLLAPDGSPATGSGCDGFSAGSRDCVLAATAGYAVEVQDSSHDAPSGSYSLNIQRLTVGQRCGTTINCDVPVSSALNSRADTNLHELAFTPVAGERVHITFGNDGGTAFFTPAWRLLAPDGSPAAGSGCDGFSAASRDCALTAASGYAVEVEEGAHDAPSGSYSLNIQRLTAGQRCGTTINCDVPVSATLNNRADTNLHELAFTPAAGERVHITFGNDGGTAFFTPAWRLLAPDGSPAAGSGCDALSAASRDCALAGTAGYAVEVEDSSHDAPSGGYSLNIQRLTAGQRCGTAINCDVPVSTTLSTRADTNLHELAFTPVVGERVHITFGNDGGTAFFTPAWRLLAPDGSPATGSGCDLLSPASRDCALNVAGAYAVEVEDSSHDASSGSYSLNVLRLTAGQRCGAAITCDVAVNNTIGSRADVNLYEFTSVGNERVHITLGNEGGAAFFNPVWRLIAPDGSPAASCGGFAPGGRVCTLTVPYCQDLGTDSICSAQFPISPSLYAIEVADSNFDSTGAISLHFQRLVGPQRCATIICDVPVITTISARADTDLFFFQGTASDVVNVNLDNLGGAAFFNPWWQLLDPAGNVVTGCDFGTADRNCTLPATGTYAVEIEDNGLDSTGNYQLIVTAPTSCGIGRIGGGIAPAQAGGSSVGAGARVPLIRPDAIAPAGTPRRVLRRKERRAVMRRTSRRR